MPPVLHSPVAIDHLKFPRHLAVRIPAPDRCWSPIPEVPSMCAYNEWPAFQRCFRQSDASFQKSPHPQPSYLKDLFHLRNYPAYNVVNAPLCFVLQMSPFHKRCQSPEDRIAPEAADDTPQKFHSWKHSLHIQSAIHKYSFESRHVRQKEVREAAIKEVQKTQKRKPWIFS